MCRSLREFPSCLYLGNAGISAAMRQEKVHSVSFIWDGANFCLGLSLIFSSIFPSPVPYSSLIFWVNLDRCRMWKYYGSAPSLSNISYNCLNMGERPSGMQIGAVEHILLYTRSSNPNSAFGTQCALSLNFLEKARPCLLFFSAICLPSLIKDTECISLLISREL